jgi:hypothetical protein
MIIKRGLPGRWQGGCLSNQNRQFRLTTPEPVVSANVVAPRKSEAELRQQQLIEMCEGPTMPPVVMTDQEFARWKITFAPPSPPPKSREGPE